MTNLTASTLAAHRISKKNIGASVIMAVLFAAAGAHAYPGATAREIETSVQVKSICYAVDGSRTNQYWYGYAKEGAKPTSKNECPADYSIVLQSNSRFVKDRIAMEAIQATGYYQYDSDKSQNLYWTTDYSVVMFESGQKRVQYMISEADFDIELKSMLTASDSTPVLYKINYAARKIEAGERLNFSANEKVIKVIGTCRIAGSDATYLLVRPATTCGEGFQFSIHEAGVTHFSQVRNNSVITVFSQFGLELFSSTLLWATRQKLDVDLRTASPEHPVLVTIDTKNKQVLKIEPTISPYAI